MNSMNPNKQSRDLVIDPETMEKILQDKAFRTTLTKINHLLFFHTYFTDYIRYPTADFHRKMFSLTEKVNQSLLVLTAFRGSAKSTIFTMSYPLWAILGSKEKKFVVILCQTQALARMHLQNIRIHLEHNDLLKSDLGPFTDGEEEWNSGSLVITDYGARIVAMSIDQSIRGIRHGAYRPDLIICDDLEDLSSVATKESRDKVYKILTGDVIPAGDLGTEIVVIGNLLHEDGLIRRLGNEIAIDGRSGDFVEIPLINGDGKVAWSEKFPTEESIKELQKKVGNSFAWNMEYLLKIVPNDDVVVRPEWIQFYEAGLFDELERCNPKVVIGVDLAISMRNSADFTAIVRLRVYRIRKKLLMVVLPNPINRRMESPEQIETLKHIYESEAAQFKIEMVIENVGYQQSIIQLLNVDGYPAIGFAPGRTDKRARLAAITPNIFSGQVLFPKSGCETLIQQLLGFGVERYDDLVDAFVIAVTHALTKMKRSRSRIHLKEGGTAEIAQRKRQVKRDHEILRAYRKENGYSRLYPYNYRTPQTSNSQPTSKSN